MGKVKRVRNPITVTYKNMQEKLGEVPNSKYWVVANVSPMKRDILSISVIKRKSWESGKVRLGAYNLILKHTDDRAEAVESRNKLSGYTGIKIVSRR